MGITQNIQKQISKLAGGTTFKYEQLNIEPQEFSAAAKAIERLIAKGLIKRVSTGVFYKPKKTVFGEIPSEKDILKTLTTVVDRLKPIEWNIEPTDFCH